MRWFDTIQVARARRAYTAVSGWRSDRAGFDGMVEEMARGDVSLSEEDRRKADHAVLTGAFVGPLGVALLRAAARRWPTETANVMARGAPFALRWLVGPLRHTPPRGNHVPQCAFRAAGGEGLCDRVCRRPSEAFLADLGLPVRLTPASVGHACDWQWGEAG